MVRTTTEEVVRGGNLAALNYRFEPMGPYPTGASAHVAQRDSDDLARELLDRH